MSWSNPLRREFGTCRPTIPATQVPNPAPEVERPEPPSEPAYARAELEGLQALIRKTDAVEAKPVVQAHLKDLAARITKALDLRAAGAGE